MNFLQISLVIAFFGMTNGWAGTDFGRGGAGARQLHGRFPKSSAEQNTVQFFGRGK